MKNRVLIIKMNLLPWYNELDDTIVIDHSDFPELVRERIAEFGDYSIEFISRNETRLKEIPKDKDTLEKKNS